MSDIDVAVNKDVEIDADVEESKESKSVTESADDQVHNEVEDQ